MGIDSVPAFVLLALGLELALASPLAWCAALLPFWQGAIGFVAGVYFVSIVARDRDVPYNQRNVYTLNERAGRQACGRGPSHALSGQDALGAEIDRHDR